MLAAAAARTARAVGADTAIRRHAPIVAAFWTISIETRLVMTSSPRVASTRLRFSVPLSLSSALCRPDVLPEGEQSVAGAVVAGRMCGVGCLMEALPGSERSDRIGNVFLANDGIFCNPVQRSHGL